MNKNTKKFVVTLLSVLMVLSFMPVMSFAAEKEYGGHEFKGTQFVGLSYVDADAEGLEVVVAPTCDEAGIGVISCDEELNGVPCGFNRVVWINSLTHKAGERKRITAAEAIDYIYSYLDDDERAEIKAYFYATHAECEGYVDVCENCGAYLYAGRSIRVHEINSMTNYERGRYYPVIDWTYHEAPADTKKCAATFTCTACGVKGVYNNEFNTDTSAVEHADEANLTHSDKKYHMKDTTGDGVADEYVEVVSDTCKICGKVVNDTTTIVPEGKASTSFAHTAGAWETKTEPTCTTPGLKVKHCTVCGLETGDQEEIPALGHDYKPITYVDDEDGLIYSVNVCTRCGTWDGKDPVPVGFSPETVDPKYTYKYTKLTDATCEQGTWIQVDVSLDNKLVDTYYLDDDDIEDMINDGYIVLIDGKYYEKSQKVEVPYEKAAGHDFGALTTVAEATCTERPLEAKVCSKCGKVDHSTVKSVGKALGHDPEITEVKATCGSEGYKESVCKRCGEDLDKDGTTTGDLRWDIVKPVVGYGVECQYEWTVTKEATATEVGEQALVCKVCGDVKYGSETVIPIDADKAKAAAAEEAKPAIEAASAIISDMDKYTDDSVIAIIAAEANLNQAITSGSAADVKKATAELQAAVNAAQEKAASKMTAKGKTVKVKYKKSKTFKANKAFTVKNAAGKVTYKKANKKGGAKIKVASNGKVTVKKGLKKGTYKVKVKITDAGSGTVLGKTKTVTLKVKITK